MTLRIMLTVIFLAFFAGYGIGHASEKKDEGTSILRGKEIYHERCAACHGVDGVSILPGAPEFAKGERLDKTDKELLQSMMHGKGDMPGWKETLSKQQCKDALTYVKLIVGEKVFAEKCLKCHGRGTPSVPSTVSKEAELKKSDKPLDICRGCEVESELSKEELLGVIRYLRAIPAGSKIE